MLPKMSARSDDKRFSLRRKLIRKEAKIGGRLFGAVPDGHHREFFCLDRHTWVWHEEWYDGGQHRALITRYELRPQGILKAQNGGPYQPVSREEAANLLVAARQYRDRVDAFYQRQLQAA